MGPLVGDPPERFPADMPPPYRTSEGVDPEPLPADEPVSDFPSPASILVALMALGFGAGWVANRLWGVSQRPEPTPASNQAAKPTPGAPPQPPPTMGPLMSLWDHLDDN